MGASTDTKKREAAAITRTGRRWFDWFNKRTHLYSSMFFLPWTDLHTRGGFGRRPGFLQIVWSVFLDIVLLAFLIWILSGLYIWWRLKSLRAWGWIAIGAGFAVFGLFVIGL